MYPETVTRPLNFHATSASMTAAAGALSRCSAVKRAQSLSFIPNVKLPARNSLIYGGFV